MAASRNRCLAAGLLAPLVLASGIVAAGHIVTEERFLAVAFEHYTESEPLRAALEAIRGGVGPDDRLLVIGESNELSPALFRWELGPPSGEARFPFPVGGEGRLDPALATRVLLVTSLGSPFEPINVARYDPARIRAVLDDIERGDLVIRADVPLADMGVALQLYARVRR